MNNVIRSTKAGNNDWSIEDYTNEIGKNPRCPDTYNNRGVLYYGLGDYDKALTDFQEAKRKSQESEIFDYNCGLAYFYCSRYSESIASLEKAIRIFKGLISDSKVMVPALLSSYYYCGLSHFHKGENDLAIINLQEAELLCPNNQEIIQALNDVKNALNK